MKNAFARRMTALRRKKGITQKQAAAELGVSQALLSHYERGLRECGLDFLLKAAEFYEVSVDALLGREELTSEVLSFAQQERGRLQSADRILFDVLQEVDDERLTRYSSDFLALAYYRLLHRLYRGGAVADGAAAAQDFTRRALADAAMQVAEARLCAVLAGSDGEGSANRTALRTDSKRLAQKYGRDFESVTELLREAEEQLKEI